MSARLDEQAGAEASDTAEPTDTRTVGVVGLGAMGGPIARHLVDAGLRPLLVDLDEDAVAPLAARGGRAADLTALADADVVLLAVATDEEVRSVCLDAGLASRLRTGAVLCICSSVLPGTADAVAAATRQADVLDTALTGGVRGAEHGSVNLLVGGDADVLDRARWALDPWTSHIHHLGPLGAGQVAKTCNNLLHWAQICAINEALELGRRHGLAVPSLRAALLDSPVSSRTLAELDKMRLTWHAKDLTNARKMGREVRQPLPVAELSEVLMRRITTQSLAELLSSGSAAHPPGCAGSSSL